LCAGLSIVLVLAGLSDTEPPAECTAVLGASDPDETACAGEDGANQTCNSI